MKAEILKMLRETDGYVSGQELCNHFGVSRTAVWKAINQLKEMGYEIEAVQNKGYHLLSVPDVINDVELESIRKTKWAGCEIHYFDTIAKHPFLVALQMHPYQCSSLQYPPRIDKPAPSLIHHTLKRCLDVYAESPLLLYAY